MNDRKNSFICRKQTALISEYVEYCIVFVSQEHNFIASPDPDTAMSPLLLFHSRILPQTLAPWGDFGLKFKKIRSNFNIVSSVVVSDCDQKLLLMEV